MIFSTSSPLVSIIMPFRNSARTLSECLDTIRAQTAEDFELIGVDDGSEDSSPEIFRSYASQDERFRLIQPGRIGLVDALNLGVHEALAPLIARMDADDLMLENRLQVQIRHMQENSEIAVLGSQVRLFPEDHIRAGYREYVRWQNRCVSASEIAANLYVESPFAHPSVLFRKPVFDEIGGYRFGPFPEDYELWLRMAAAGFRMEKVPEVLLLWRERGDRISRTDVRYSREAFDRLRARFLARELRRRGVVKPVIWGAGRTTRKRARYLLQKGIQILAWIDINPRKIGKVIWNCPVHASSWLIDLVPKPFVLIYVTNHGAREEISAELEKSGYRAGIHYLAVG